MGRYSTKPVKISEGTYAGIGFEQRRSKKNPAAPGQMMVEVALQNGMVVWVPENRVLPR